MCSRGTMALMMEFRTTWRPTMTNHRQWQQWEHQLPFIEPRALLDAILTWSYAIFLAYSLHHESPFLGEEAEWQSSDTRAGLTPNLSGAIFRRKDWQGYPSKGKNMLFHPELCSFLTLCVRDNLPSSSPGTATPYREAHFDSKQPCKDMLKAQETGWPVCSKTHGSP